MIRQPLLIFAIAGLVALMVGTASAQTLTITGRNSAKTYTRGELLANPATREITIADPVYHRTMTYRAIPAALLLKDGGLGPDDYVQARAVDDFSIGVPGHLFDDAAHVEPFVAIEDPAAPWPSVPGKSETAGPYYLVWRIVPPATVSAEFWAYHLAALAVTDGPVKRWPALGVGADVPADDPIRTGLAPLFAVLQSPPAVRRQLWAARSIWSLPHYRRTAARRGSQPCAGSSRGSSSRHTEANKSFRQPLRHRAREQSDLCSRPTFVLPWGQPLGCPRRPIFEFSHGHIPANFPSHQICRAFDERRLGASDCCNTEDGKFSNDIMYLRKNGTGSQLTCCQLSEQPTGVWLRCTLRPDCLNLPESDGSCPLSCFTLTLPRR